MRQSTATSSDTYNYENGAIIRCRRSGNVITITASNIGSSIQIDADTSFSFDVGMDNKYKPASAVAVYGNKRGNYSGSDSIRYTINTDGSISGYAYNAAVTGGAFTITFVK